MFRELLEDCPFPVIILDAENLVVLANEAAEKLFRRNKLVGSAFKAPAGNSTVQLGRRTVNVVEHRFEFEEQELRVVWFFEEHDLLWARLLEVEVQLKASEQEIGRTRRAYEVSEQQTREAFIKLRQTEQRCQELESQLNQTLQEAVRPSNPKRVFEDPVTALPSGAILDDFMELALDDIDSSDRSLALLILDIDRFQAINDLLGERAGDELLRAVADRLRPLLGEKDVLVRRGADEFVAVLFADPEGMREADEIARDRTEEFHRRVCNVMDHSVVVATQSIHVTISIGAVLYSRGGQRLNLMSEALGALHAAKERGRGDLYFFSPRLRAQLEERRSLVGQLRQAIDEEQFVLHYQPIIELSSGKLAGAEALLRWNHPARGLLAPAHFLAVAEESNLIAPIGDWVTKQACRQAAMMPELFFSINLSPQQLVHSRFVESFFFAIERVQANPECLVVELPEGRGTTRNEQVREVLKELAIRGVQLGIDDFGSGSSSLKDLLGLELRFLKVDQVFVNKVPGDEQSTHIAESIVALAKSFRTDCLAEGLETYAQVISLKKLGCRYGQGHYFSKAVNADVLEEIRGNVWKT